MSKPINLSGSYLPQRSRTLYVPIGKKTDFESSSYYLDQYSLFKDIIEYGETPTILTSKVLNEDNNNPVIYNLKGVRLSNKKGLHKGVYIINGKKVVQK